MERRRLARLRGAVEPSDCSAPPQPNDRQLRPTAQPRRHHTGPRPAADVERTELRLVPPGDKSPAARWQHGCETGGRNLPAMRVAGQAQIEASSRCGRIDECGAVSQQQFDGRVATWLQRPRAPARRVVGRVDGEAAVAGLPGLPRVDDHQQLQHARRRDDLDHFKWPGHRQLFGQRGESRHSDYLVMRRLCAALSSLVFLDYALGGG